MDIEQYANAYAEAGINYARNLQSSRAEKKAAKDILRSAIGEWLEEQGLEANIMINGFEVRNDTWCGRGIHLAPAVVYIWNSKGSIQGGGWLNKIGALGSSGKVKAHKVRTDPDFLHPTEWEFAEFIGKLWKAVDKAVNERKG